HELELRLLTDAAILMTHQLDQALHRPIAEVRRHQGLDLRADGAPGAFGRIQLPEPALAGRAPAADPVAQIDGAVRTDGHPGTQDAANDFLVLAEIEAGALRREGEREDARGGGIAGETRPEEVIPVARVERRA